MRPIYPGRGRQSKRIWGGTQGNAPPTTQTAGNADITIKSGARVAFFGDPTAGAATFNINPGGLLQINDAATGGWRSPIRSAASAPTSLRRASARLQSQD